MAVSYKQERSSCSYYKNGGKPDIEIYTIEKDHNWNFLPEGNWIVAIIKGQLSFSFGQFSDRTIQKGQMMLLSSGYQFTSLAESTCEVISINIHSNNMYLCDCFAIESLLKEKLDGESYDFTILDTNVVVWNYLKDLKFYIEDGIQCNNFFNAKTKELFFLLQRYYSKKELLCFFYFYLTNDIGFSDLIKRHSHKAKNVQELAELTNYSISGFHKRFKRVFGISAYQWMIEQRSRNILHEIHYGNKTLKQISDEYGFSSPSHFNDFCKAHYKAPPGLIRQNKK